MSSCVIITDNIRAFSAINNDSSQGQISRFICCNVIVVTLIGIIYSDINMTLIKLSVESFYIMYKFILIKW